MDALSIGVVAVVVVFMIVGLVFEHYGNKVSEKMQIGRASCMEKV